MLVERKCKNCGKVFEARQADVNRGWGLFHNKSCKAKYQERMTGQYEHSSRNMDDEYDAGKEAVEFGWGGHKNTF
jgi:DNA-directed RNA polymerase subunit M/transcription elongation factor TFIIS